MGLDHHICTVKRKVAPSTVTFLNYIEILGSLQDAHDQLTFLRKRDNSCLLKRKVQRNQINQNVFIREDFLFIILMISCFLFGMLNMQLQVHILK